MSVCLDILKTIRHCIRQTYDSYALWDGDERSTFWGRKVEGQGQGGITIAIGWV